jgi:glycerol-3-phosphate acyltransferase PlsX
MRLAIDGMGGDFGPRPIVEGVVEALKAREDFTPYLVGDEEVLKKLLPTQLHPRVRFINSRDVIGMGESATDAVKRQESTIYKSIDLLKNGEVEGVVSAGHSGATMSLATLKLGRIRGIKRPAIVTFMPNREGSYTLILDVGANVDCDPIHLYQFALMGEVYGKVVLKKSPIRVGLLSNGEEEGKGNGVTKEAFKMLSQFEWFIGNVEGGDIFNGSVEVVVCDGFIGNIVLKTSEGAGEVIGSFLKEGVKKGGVLVKLGAFLMKPVFESLKKRIDYAEYGGAPLLGVKGCVIISHGKSNSKAIKNAIFQGLDYIENRVTEKIEEMVKVSQCSQK